MPPTTARHVFALVSCLFGPTRAVDIPDASTARAIMSGHPKRRTTNTIGLEPLRPLRPTSAGSIVVRNGAHEDSFEVGVRRVRQALGEEVCHVKVSAEKVHTQPTFPDMVTSTKVAGIKVFAALRG